MRIGSVQGSVQDLIRWLSQYAKVQQLMDMGARTQKPKNIVSENKIMIYHSPVLS